MTTVKVQPNRGEQMLNYIITGNPNHRSLDTYGDYPNLDNAYGSQRVIQLPTGRNINLSDVNLNEAQQQWYYGTMNVTAYLSPDQRRLYDGFDIEAYNNQLYMQHMNDTGQAINPGGSTSIADLFLTGVSNDIQDAENFVGENGPKALANTAKILTGAAIIAGVVLLIKILPKSKSPNKKRIS